MTTRPSWLWLLAVALVAPLRAEQVVIEWRFDQPGQMLGWQPNHMIRDVTVADGALRGRTVDWDPFLTSPELDFPARPWQMIELVITADTAGEGQVYFTNTTDTPHGGFSPSLQVKFSLAASDQPQTVRMRPFWQAQQRIIRLRLDLHDGLSFAIHAIRIVEPESEAIAAGLHQWDFTAGAAGWTGEGVTDLAAGPAGVQLKMASASGLIKSPPLQTPIDDLPFAAVTMAVDRGSRASIVYATAEAAGLQSVHFPIRADGKPHTYLIDLASSNDWQGNLLALGLRPSRTAGAQATVHAVQLTAELVGPPDLEIVFAGLSDWANRVGQWCPVEVRLTNHGGTSARGVGGELVLPAGLEQREVIPSVDLEFGQTKRLLWEIRGQAPVAGEATIRLAGPGAPTEPLRVPVAVTPKVAVPAGDYVPAPRPAKTDYLIGTYYFPGWGTADRWEPIDRVAPIRRPVLGWYDESLPEIADWQIKWAVEHGVNFFLVDWYWTQGRMNLLHWLEQAYANAQFKEHLKWALMWANHNPPNTHSEADWRAVTQYWIDHYFRQPTYLYQDGKPVVYLWAPGNLRRDLGGTDEARRMLAISDEMCRAAGLPGVTFAAMNAGRTPEEARVLAAEGYAYNATYHWWADAPARAEDPRYFPFSLVAERSYPGWVEREQIVEAAGMKLIPTADTGWASEPWHGDEAMVIHDRTVPLFESILRDAKRYLDERGEKMLILGPWNEWGEGSYIEPCREFGFDMLQAVWRVFCQGDEPPLSVTPVDVGRGPYDFAELPSPSDRDDWDFVDGTAQGWRPIMQIRDFAVADGAIKMVSTGNDPALGGPRMRLMARNFVALEVRMRLTGATEPGGLQVFYSSSRGRHTEAKSVREPVIADGQWRTYRFDLTAARTWRGLIEDLRLDPCSAPDTTIEIDSIRFIRRAQ